MIFWIDKFLKNKSEIEIKTIKDPLRDGYERLIWDILRINTGTVGKIINTFFLLLKPLDYHFPVKTIHSFHFLSFSMSARHLIFVHRCFKAGEIIIAGENIICSISPNSNFPFHALINQSTLDFTITWHLFKI